MRGRITATLIAMLKRDPPRSEAYDPFGEIAELDVVGAPSPAERRIQFAAVAVFWVLVSALTIGRVHSGNQTFAPAPIADQPGAVLLSAGR